MEWALDPQVLVTHDNLFHSRRTILITDKLDMEYKTTTKQSKADCVAG